MTNRWERILAELERLWHLEAKARTIVHRHIRDRPAKELGFEAVVKETRLRASEYEREIAATIASWEWGGELATLHDEAQMWRYVRLNTALQWLSMVVEVPGAQKVLGLPELSDREVIQWFLTDWWMIGGVHMRAMFEMGS